MTAPMVPSAPTVVAPMPSQNRMDAEGRIARDREAKRIMDSHRAGLESRRARDLLSEKLLLHIDGTGDLQWADIFKDTRVVIPRDVSGYRKQENLLRPIVDNAVAHHTTQPLRYMAESGQDRRSRDRSLLDGLLANHITQTQDLNGVFAEGLYLSMAAGFTPVHRYWREDRNDQYEPVTYGGAGDVATALQQLNDPTPGIIDCFVGNPFDTVFSAGSKRTSIYAASYGRVLPADMVRKAFAHLPEAQTIRGDTRVPSAALFQRIAQRWKMEGLGIHGAGVMQDRRGTEGEELILLLCREILPGVDVDWPMGRLSIVAVNDIPDLRRREGASTGQAVMLVDQDLPASDFSFTNFYSHQRTDDVLGKPWAEDLDQLQVDLNVALSKRWEQVIRQADAPIFGPGGALSEDMLNLGEYEYVEIEPSMASWRPNVLQYPAGIIVALDKEVAERRQALYTIGGYQAVSRGESLGSRTAAKTILALQSADKTIHGPVNQRFQRSACDFMLGCWKQFRAYGDVVWALEVVGDEYAHLVQPYIDNTQISERRPNYKLVNNFGSSPEARAQEVLQLAQTRGADGEPFITTEEARRLYPDATLHGDLRTPKAVARRRARTVASAFNGAAERVRRETQYAGTMFSDPMVIQLGQQVFQQIAQEYPILRDDDLQAHVEALTELTQDETADPIARIGAVMRQHIYYQWQAQQAAVAMPAQGNGPKAVASDQRQISAGQNPEERSPQRATAGM